MTNRANLARQIAAYATVYPEQATPLLEYLVFAALHDDKAQAISGLIPDHTSRMGAALLVSLGQLHSESHPVIAPPAATPAPPPAAWMSLGSK